MKKIPDDIKQMDGRIRKLKAKEQRTREEKTESQFAHAAKVGFRIGAELISGVIVGYLLDILFGTRPLLLIIFLFLGGVAGFLNVYRFVKSMEKEQE